MLSVRLPVLLVFGAGFALGRWQIYRHWHKANKEALERAVRDLRTARGL